MNCAGMNRIVSRRWIATLLALALAGAGAGCESPQPRRQHPPGTLQVRYESASSYAGCLTASVAMAANYVLGEYRYNDARLRHELAQAELDETQPGDVKTYLESIGLHLVTLRGELDGNPPLGLRYWVLQRGYPAICVINAKGDDPDMNHAVVVIGFSKMQDPQAADTFHADTIYYLDPANEQPLQEVTVDEFETMWARAGHAMMLVVRPPAPSGRAAG